MLNCELLYYDRHSTKHNMFQYHKHNCYEIVYFLSGKGTSLMGNTSYSFYPNSFCIIPPNTVHKECMDDMGEIVFLRFQYDNRDYKIHTGMYHYNVIIINSLIKDIIKECNEKKNGYEIIARAHLCEMLVRISRMKQTVRKNLQETEEYIREFYDKKIDFTELAAMSGYSYDYFRHHFKDVYGTYPQNYLFEIRLQKAKEFLSSSTLSCTEVGYICGFSSSSHFSRIFKRRYGLSPKQYKNSLPEN